MDSRKRSTAVRLVAMVLVMALILPVGVHAATVETVQPRASYYLNSYGAYVYPAGGGRVQVWFSVTGTGDMDEIGALRISIYESVNGSTWTVKETHTHVSTPGLLGYDDYYHSGHITYSGIAGRYYKAYVGVWAGKNGDGDNRYFWTSVKKAT